MRSKAVAKGLAGAFCELMKTVLDDWAVASSGRNGAWAGTAADCDRPELPSTTRKDGAGACFVQDGSIGQLPPKAPRKPFDFLEMADWVGHRFIFLPKWPSVRKYGYQGFNGGSGEFGQPTYQECAGKICEVTQVVVDGSRISKIAVRMVDSGKRYTADVYTDWVHGIALLEDLEEARRRWTGRTLWFRKNQVLVYDAGTDKTEALDVTPGSPMVVRRILAGQIEPVRFVLETPLGVGYMEVNLSGTNISRGVRQYNRFDEYFSESPF